MEHNDENKVNLPSMEERSMDDSFETDLKHPKNSQSEQPKSEEKVETKQKITELTPEILAKIPEYKERCVNDLYSGKEWENFNPHVAIEYIEKIYELANQQNKLGNPNKPVIIFADSPDEYKRLFRTIHKENALTVLHRIYTAKNGISNESFTYDEEQDMIQQVLANTKLTKKDEFVIEIII